MRKQMEYQKPQLLDYEGFGIVVEGDSPGAPGAERSDVESCNIGGLDEA